MQSKYYNNVYPNILDIVTRMDEQEEQFGDQVFLNKGG